MKRFTMRTKRMFKRYAQIIKDLRKQARHQMKVPATKKLAQENLDVALFFEARLILRRENKKRAKSERRKRNKTK